MSEAAEMGARARNDLQAGSGHPVDEQASAEMYDQFRREYADYEKTKSLDELRRREFGRLDEQGQIYLDYTGGGLYADSQVRQHSELLLTRILGNPHSSNPTANSTHWLVEETRRRVGEFFNASPEKYVVIFTANASHALKLVGESYPFQAGDQFLLTYDNHNSVNGIREFDRARGAKTTYVPVNPPEMQVDRDVLQSFLDTADPSRNNLFAYPAQSNFSGVQHPLEWIEWAQERGWDVLLDAAAFVPTNRLDLTRWHPDYVAISFYKIFGYPTGVGALIASREALQKLHRPWFAGGTITVASVQADRHYMASGASAFEDGTLDYANLPAVRIGLDFVESVGLDRVHLRVQCLTDWLIKELLKLCHSNGRPLIQLYGPSCKEQRGGTVTINFVDRDGHVMDHEVVERAANLKKISLRTGCFCNPGAGEVALGLTREKLVSCFSRSDSRMTLQDFRGCINTEGTGAVRVSVGLASNFGDVFAFTQFAREFLQV